jgi:hypothetical protein
MQISMVGISAGRAQRDTHLNSARPSHLLYMQETMGTKEGPFKGGEENFDAAKALLMRDGSHLL